jgi:hypothetical protein
MHDGGTLDLDSLIAIARAERSGEIAPATATRLAQFQAAFDAAAQPAAAPAAICFAFHASVPQAEAAVKYRDVSIDHSKFDYGRIVRHCIAAALAAQPGARFVLATDSQFLTDIEHPALTIVRLPLDQASPMYERVIAMCAFVRSRQFTAPTAFLDSDAFLNAPIANLFQNHFDIGATYRPDPGLMPINEGVILAASRNKDAVRAFFTGYLGTYDRLCGNAAVTGYYGNIKRWRGGQLSLNALTCPQGVPSALDSAKAFGARIRYYPCATFNFSIEMDRPYSPRQLDTRAVLHLKGPRKAILDPIVAYQTQRWPQIAQPFAAPKPIEQPKPPVLTKPVEQPKPAEQAAPAPVAPAPMAATEAPKPAPLEAKQPAAPALPSLAEIAAQLQLDQASSRARSLPLYERYFGPLRGRAGLQLLEIGPDDGVSLDIWARYFKDVRAVRAESETEPAEGSFDIVIDDGSDSHIVAAFRQNWPNLKPDGLFMIASLERTRDSHQARRSLLTLIESSLKDMDEGEIDFVHIHRDIAVIKKSA